MRTIAQYLIVILLSATTTMVIGFVVLNTPALSRIIAQQIIQDAGVTTSAQEGRKDIAKTGLVSFPLGAEFGTDNILVIDKEGNLDTKGTITLGDLYVGGTAFLNSLNIADFLYVAGNKIIDASGRIPALTIDYIANLDGSAITGVNADKLDGVDSTGFIKTGTAIDADKLDGKDSSEFITSGTAIDADKLDGIDSTSFLRSDTADTAGGALTFTAVPGSANVGGGSLYINPASSTADYTLLGVAVNGTEKFRVDGEGDVFIGGVLNLSGNTLTSDGDLVLDASGGGVKIGTGTPGSVDLGGDDLYVTGDIETDGTFFGTLNPGFTTGSIPFQGLSGLTQDNASLFWDDSNNKLGIGTNSPTSKLHVSGSVTGKALSIFNQTGDQDIFTASVSGSTRFNIQNNGNVNIYSPSASTALNVIVDGSANNDANATLKILAGRTSGRSELFLGDADDDDAGAIKYDHAASSNYMRFFTNGLERMRLNSSGNLHVGSGAPAANMQLDVAGRVQLNLGGTQTSVALCGSHASGGGAAVSDVEIVDCTGTPGADYMEMYPVEVDAGMGTVVAVGGNNVTTKDGDTIKQLVKSTSGYQSNLIGIVSDKTKAGDFNSIGYNIEDKDNPQPIALAGRVPVKVASNSQEIQAGDFITSSSEAGKAMKATQAGYVIGKALESWSPNSGKSTVMVFVNNSYYIGGDSTLGSGSFLSLNSTQDLSNTDSLSGNSNQTIITELQTMEGLSFDEESKTLSATSIFKTIEEFVAEGIATFKNTVKFLADVTFGGRVLFENKVEFADKDLAGYAKIKSGSNEVKVSFENKYTYAPIIQVTPQGIYNIKYAVTDVSTKGFTIKIDPSLSEEVQFSWSALAVKDAKTYEGNESSATPDPTATPSPSPAVEPIEESTSNAEVEIPPSTQSATVSQ